MTEKGPVPMVRCRLGPVDDTVATLRYVRFAEFELWRYMMETRHQREVVVEEVSLWVPDDGALATSSIGDAELCEAVVRVRFDVPSSYGFPLPIERFLPAETYPEAQAALLSHFDWPSRIVTATAGYFVPAAARLEAVY